MASSDIEQVVIVPRTRMASDEIEEVVVVLNEPDASVGQKRCIFRVPPLLLKTDPEAFTPQLVSIGPFHSPMFQTDKERVLELFIKIAKKGSKEPSSVIVSDLEADVGNLDAMIRSSYSETLSQDREALARMMVMDGCFIVMIIFLASGNVSFSLEDTDFSVPYILRTVQGDLLLLQNQVPFKVLEILFEKLGLSVDTTFRRLACTVFQCLLGHMSAEALGNIGTEEPRHLLDLLRRTWIPALSSDETQQERYRGPRTPQFLLSAKELETHGIKFGVRRNAEIMLEINFRRNICLIPSMILDRFTRMFLLNGVAYEQYLSRCDDFMTSYVVSMGFFMRDKEGGSLICNQKIIQNCFGMDEEASHFFTEASKSVVFNLSRSYLAPVFQDINVYTSKLRSGQWTSIKRDYCVWKCFRSITFVLAFIVGILQLTWYTLLQER